MSMALLFLYRDEVFASNLSVVSKNENHFEYKLLQQFVLTNIGSAVSNKNQAHVFQGGGGNGMF